MKIRCPIIIIVLFIPLFFFIALITLKPAVYAQDAVEYSQDNPEPGDFQGDPWTDPDTGQTYDAPTPTGSVADLLGDPKYQPAPGGGWFVDVNGNKTKDNNQDFGQGILTEIGYFANNTPQDVIDAIQNTKDRGQQLSIAKDSGYWRSTFGDGGDGGGGSPLVFVPPTPTPTPTPVPPAGNWLKVVGGDVYSGGRINMTVPPPAGQYNAAGVVTSGSSITNFQTVSNWVIPNYSITSGKFDYDYFFKRFKSRAVPISSPIASSTSLDDETIYLYNQSGDLLLDSNGANFNNKKIAILINGNLRIQNSSNKFTPQNASVIFITSGNVIINPNMTEINAAIVSTGNMNTGTGTIPLTIKGLLVSYGGFSLGRAPASSATPGETVIYDPNLVVTLNDLIGITNFFWQEVAP